MLLGTTTAGNGNADNLTIADSGNCGITIRSGTSNFGEIYFSDATSGAAEYDGYIAYNNSRYMVLATAQTERLRIDSSGFIKQKFTSNNSTTAEGLFINNLNNGTGNNASLILSNDSGERKKAAIALIDTGSYGAGDLVFALDGADSGELHLTNDEKLRITSGGTLFSYSPDDTTPNFKFRSNDTNWHGALNQSVEGGTITSFLSCGGDWSANGTTYSATKALAAYPTSAIAIHNQYNSSWGSQFVFLTKAGGSSTTDGAVTERLRIDSSGRALIGSPNGSTSQFLQIKGDTGAANNGGTILLQNGVADSSAGNGTGLGGIAFGGATGNQYCRIEGFADGSGGTNDYPGRIVFSTTRRRKQSN